MIPKEHAELLALRKRQGGFYEFNKDGIALIVGFGRVCADLPAILSKLLGPADLKRYLIELHEWALAEELKARRDQAATTPAKKVKTPKRTRGTIYILKSEHGLYKIGKTAGSLDARLRALLTASPYRLQLTHSFPAENCHATEKALHERFASQRQRGEWFNLSRDDVRWLREIKNGSEIK